MKTFDESDLITWSNRHEAKIGAKGYFGHSIAYLNANIKANHVYELINISDDFSDCFSCSISGDIRSYDFYLPIEAVKEEKNYRPCKTIKEFYEVINNYGSDSFPNKYFRDENFIYNLLDTTIHFRSRSTYVEYFSNIVSICKKDNTGIRVLFRGKSYLSFEQIFTSYEIELNGKWLPFGVLDED